MNKYIWIIDDDEGILEVVTIILTEAGYRVKQIDSEKTLESSLKAELPSLILLDVLISGLDGRDVAKRFKNDEKTKHIPIILMSAHTNLEQRAQEAGADAHLKKPFDIHVLEDLVKGYLEK